MVSLYLAYKICYNKSGETCGLSDYIQLFFNCKIVVCLYNFGSFLMYLLSILNYRLEFNSRCYIRLSVFLIIFY